MKWTISLPRVVAEDDQASVTVEADTIEDAILKASVTLRSSAQPPPPGTVFLVNARVEVAPRSKLPLRSI